MKKDYITETCEMALAKQVAQFISELRLIDVGDLIACIHTERFNHLSELIESATELRFYPHTMRFARNASYELDWDTTQKSCFIWNFQMKVYKPFSAHYVIRRIWD
ncbi:hypothetical protein [Bartonella bovis]|uniref:Uncharacterized protein n=1 Tax=Bartonella bovis m02 TaxID=1094492 RepID=N6UI31_9HYPH|nr:hypothetical protein [Bartonella bovis]ENN89903.1 hypothetical protein m02_10920 [Bartonella bovis m02]